MAPQSALELLRKEHVELQNKYAVLQQNYTLLQAKIDPTQLSDVSTLSGQLVASMKSLFEYHTFSDVIFHVDGQELKCHRFLLLARSTHWDDLESRDYIDIPEISFKSFYVVYRWLYCLLLPDLDIDILKDVCRFACSFHFTGLQERCVQLLNALVDVDTCIALFEFADSEDVAELRDHCSGVITAHWNELESHALSGLSAPSLLRLLKRNSRSIVHSIVQLDREDVLLLYFIENHSKYRTTANILDQDGLSPLELALSLGHLNIADTLVKKGADCNAVDISGRSMLVRMIEKGDAAACKFLSSAGAGLTFIHGSTRSTILHYIASCPLNQISMADWADSRILETDRDTTDSHGRTALLMSIANGNVALAKVLLRHGADATKSDNEGKSPLYVALLDMGNTELSQEIVKSGGRRSLDHCIAGDSLLHIAVREGILDAVHFLVQCKASVDALNFKKETALELAVKRDNVKLVLLLLDNGASVSTVSCRVDSVLHKAVLSGPEMLSILLEKAKDVDWSTCGVLRYALDQRLLDCAKIIIFAGASVEERDATGNTLLVQRILLADDLGAALLLQQRAEHVVKDSCGRSCFELAVFSGVMNTLKMICGLGVNINERTNGGLGYTVLKHALSEEHYDCASLLVSLGCDLNSSTADGQFVQTMLHYFIDVSDERAAVFLIQSGCSCDAARISRDVNDSTEEFPLHRAVGIRMNTVVAALVSAKANLAAQDSQGRTGCHVAIQEHNSYALAEQLKSDDVSFLSVRDKAGQTPLARALFSKEYVFAAEILKRQPHAALQIYANGENLLHTSVKANGLESVLFLLSARIDTSRVAMDGSYRNALHYAANVDNELILRNLLLAGSEIDVRAADGSTPLHIAARTNRPLHVEILLENGANPNTIDERGENALLSAVRCGSIDSVKVLVKNPTTVSLLKNKSGQSALHLCAVLKNDKLQPYGSAVEMCEALLEKEVHRLPERDFASYVDLQDTGGNTALLLAYMTGNGDLCRCLLRFGATMGARNVDGSTMFTYETPTRLLLFRLLDSLEREPRWSDGDMCDCGVRFSITVRKHHCRHCGRLVCSKCSEITMPIAKFGEEKRVRVCSLCAEVLTTGSSR